MDWTCVHCHDVGESQTSLWQRKHLKPLFYLTHALLLKKRKDWKFVRRSEKLYWGARTPNSRSRKCLFCRCWTIDDHVGRLRWTYLVRHGALLCQVLRVRWHQVLHCGARSHSGLVSSYCQFNLLRTRRHSSPVLTSAARKSRTKSSPSPGHIPSLNTTIVSRCVRAADSNFRVQHVKLCKLTLFLAFMAKWRLSSFAHWQSARPERQRCFIHDWHSKINAKKHGVHLKLRLRQNIGLFWLLSESVDPAFNSNCYTRSSVTSRPSAFRRDLSSRYLRIKFKVPIHL